MAIERKWPAVAPHQFTMDGTTLGLITLSDTIGFKVKQRVVIQSSTQPQMSLQVKRVTKTTVIVGPNPQPSTQKAINERYDISAYLAADGAFIFAAEQDKSLLKPDDITQAVYEQEPAVAIRVIGVNANGDVYSEINPLPVVIAGSGGGDTLPYTDDIKIIRDSDDDAVRYEFYLGAALKYYISVTYNANKSAIDYKTTVI